MRFIANACCLALLLCLVGCDFARGQWSEAKEAYREATTPTRDIERGARPEVIIGENAISFDGKPLRLGSDIREWTAVLGTDYREHHNSVIWDDRGLAVFVSRQGPKKVEGFEISLNFKQTIADTVPGSGRAPANAFDGYLELNGVAVDSKSTARETNRRANGKVNITCSQGLNLCSDTVERNIGSLLSFEVDSRKEDSIFYYVQIERYP